MPFRVRQSFSCCISTLIYQSLEEIISASSPFFLFFFFFSFFLFFSFLLFQREIVLVYYIRSVSVCTEMVVFRSNNYKLHSVNWPPHTIKYWSRDTFICQPVLNKHEAFCSKSKVRVRLSVIIINSSRPII